MPKKKKVTPVRRNLRSNRKSSPEKTEDGFELSNAVIEVLDSDEELTLDCISQSSLSFDEFPHRLKQIKQQELMEVKKEEVTPIKSESASLSATNSNVTDDLSNEDDRKTPTTNFKGVLIIDSDDEMPQLDPVVDLKTPIPSSNMPELKVISSGETSIKEESNKSFTFEEESAGECDESSAKVVVKPEVLEVSTDEPDISHSEIDVPTDAGAIPADSLEVPYESMEPLKTEEILNEATLVKEADVVERPDHDQLTLAILKEFDDEISNEKSVPFEATNPSLMSMIATLDFDLAQNLGSSLSKDFRSLKATSSNSSLFNKTDFMEPCGDFSNQQPVDNTNLTSNLSAKDESKDGDHAQIQNKIMTADSSPIDKNDDTAPTKNKIPKLKINIKSKDKTPKPERVVPVLKMVLVEDNASGSQSYKILDKKSKAVKKKYQPKKVQRIDAFTQTSDGKIKASHISCQGCNKNFVTGVRESQELETNHTPNLIQHLLSGGIKGIPKTEIAKAFQLQVKTKNERKSLRPHKIPTTSKSDSIEALPHYEEASDNQNYPLMQTQVPQPPYSQQCNMTNYNLLGNNIVYGPNDYYTIDNEIAGCSNSSAGYEMQSLPKKSLIPRGSYENASIIKKDDIKRIGRFQDLYDHPLKKKLMEVEPPQEATGDPAVDEPMDELRAQEEALFGSVLSDDEPMSQCSSGSAKFSDDEELETRSTASADLFDDQNQMEEDVDMELDDIYVSHNNNVKEAEQQTDYNSDISDIDENQIIQLPDRNEKLFQEMLAKTPLELDNNDVLDFDECNDN